MNDVYCLRCGLRWAIRMRLCRSALFHELVEVSGKGRGGPDRYRMQSTAPANVTKYPVWFETGFYSGNPWSALVVDAEGEITDLFVQVVSR